jgi:signal transduction histidine kinase
VVERARIAVLFVDKSEADVALAVRELRRNGLAPTWERVADAMQLRAALELRRWDAVVCDSSVPHLGVFEVLALTRELAPTTPFVVISAALDDRMAVEIVRRGAVDFVSKHNLVRLAAAIVREVERPITAATTPQIAAMQVAAREAEARRIAIDLHDRIGQLLAVIARSLEAAQRGDPIIRGGQLAAARGLTDEAIRNVRELSTELWPSILDDLGLLPALRWLADRYTTRLGCVVTLTADDIKRLPPAIETACYRIAEAALANVARHADARAVAILLRVTDAFDLELMICDDGRGFDPDAAWRRAARGESLGLVAMRERALLAGGKLTLVTAPGVGTTVRVNFAVGGN